VVKKHFKYLIEFFIIFIVVELLLMMRLIIFSDNPITWGKFFSLLPLSVIVGIVTIISRAFLFMSPSNKKTNKPLDTQS
jgi:hypothetical protein